MAETSPVIPAFMNNRYWKAIRQGNYLELIFDCPHEISEVTSNKYVSDMLRELKDDYKELLYYLVIRGYSTAQLSGVLSQTDRNIRKKYHRLLSRLQGKLYNHLLLERKRRRFLTARETDFLRAYNETAPDNAEQP